MECYGKGDQKEEVINVRECLKFNLNKIGEVNFWFYLGFFKLLLEVGNIFKKNSYKTTITNLLLFKNIW